ncbi:preprotein translocase subunit YajC [Nocardiopsis trehalosi]|uniref:preprotein translocase subunit YajC n=1 Tax=Nocardiopsis trehalosi TaxID=109329 RepID=UPI000831DF1F|nr:preprotein translocase subunit YajC [Nocardiopsis trehalosi]
MQGTYTLADAAAQSGGASLLQPIMMILLIGVVFWLLFLRPQKKMRERESQMQSRLQPGVEVLTKAGFYATVVDVRENEVELEISPGSRIRMLKAGVGDVVTPQEPAADDTPVEDRPDFGRDDNKDDGPK